MRKRDVKLPTLQPVSPSRAGNLIYLKLSFKDQSDVQRSLPRVT